MQIMDFAKVCSNFEVQMFDRNSGISKLLQLEKTHPYYFEIMNLKIDSIREENGKIVVQPKFDKRLWKCIRKKEREE